MRQRLDDSHNHLASGVFREDLPEIISALKDAGVAACVANGTCEGDWPAVRRLADVHRFIIPAFGVHPWNVDEISPDWQGTLGKFLDSPGATIGEIGLDRWKTDHNFEHQKSVFRWQLEQAIRRHVPATIHCLRAWGALAEILRDTGAPQCGFLLHAFGGPVEMVESFAEMGAFFSFSASFLGSGREHRRAPFAIIPENRLLIETDAPAMPPPKSICRYELNAETGDGTRLHHPADLPAALTGLAGIRKIPPDQMAGILHKNFRNLFSPAARTSGWASVRNENPDYPASRPPPGNTLDHPHDLRTRIARAGSGSPLD